MGGLHTRSPDERDLSITVEFLRGLGLAMGLQGPWVC